jgi:hypothetical protein
MWPARAARVAAQTGAEAASSSGTKKCRFIYARAATFPVFRDEGSFDAESPLAFDELMMDGEASLNCNHVQSKGAL